MYESFLRLKGRKIFEKHSEKYLGRLSDILVNKDTNNIIGIVSENDALLYRHRFFKSELISEWDNLRITVTGFGEKFVKIVPVFSDYTSCENDIFKRKAVFSDGSEAGKIQNINFDMETGVIGNLEVGTSIIQDLLSGRMICPNIQKIEYCHDKIVLDNLQKKENK